jgi:pimeloyl-ACP methyl ester carboxylesterase
MAGLYAYEPPYINAGPGAKADPEYRTKMERLVADGDRAGAVTYFMRFVGVPGIGVAIMKVLPMWNVMLGVAHTLPYDARIMDGFDVPAGRFRKIAVPTVVGAGEKTTPGLKAGAKAAADAVPRAQHRIVPKSNHGIKPKAMTAELSAVFLAASLPK